jgi:DNA-directed RNA polymerase subunit F
MVKPTLVSEEPMALADVKAELEKIKARDTTLNFRAGRCEEYLNDFAPVGTDKIALLRKKLEGLDISRLKKEHIVALLDMYPQTPDDVKAVFSGGTVSISRKDMERIAELFQETK